MSAMKWDTQGKTCINTKTINNALRHYKTQWDWKNSTLHAALQAIQFSLHTDVIRVLQGKLEGCTVNSQGVILNHTTYYLNPDAHIFN